MTRREAFEALEGKTGRQRYLRAIRSASVVIFRVSPTRSADTPIIHFAGMAPEVVLVCDRYSAYKSPAGDIETILSVFCRYHVRRDFWDAARSYPELKTRMFVWVEDIRELYRLNALRVQAWDAARPLTTGSGIHGTSQCPDRQVGGCAEPLRNGFEHRRPAFRRTQGAAKPAEPSGGADPLRFTPGNPDG